MTFIIKIKNKRRLLIDAADKPKILQATSSQFKTGLERICSLRFVRLFAISSPLEQPAGPETNLFSMPTCQIE